MQRIATTREDGKVPTTSSGTKLGAGNWEEVDSLRKNYTIRYRNPTQSQGEKIRKKSVSDSFLNDPCLFFWILFWIFFISAIRRRFGHGGKSSP